MPLASDDSHDPFSNTMPTVSPFDMDPRVQAWRIVKMEQAVGRLERLVGEMHTKSLTQKPCPNPGACVTLDTRVREISARLATIESFIEQGKGAGQLVKVLYLLFGAALAGAVAKWLLR